ncbi:hypothetical protein Syun_028888 [Stephania yunnanensis]|uniref:Secreted protein n=1 Tax=Stephania yunnanensis TaxID=152371 RepID=A0AAP0E4L1_9MAGN
MKSSTVICLYALKLLHLSTMAIASNDSQLWRWNNIYHVEIGILRIASLVFINNVLLFYKDLISKIQANKGIDCARQGL